MTIRLERKELMPSGLVLKTVRDFTDVSGYNVDGATVGIVLNDGTRHFIPLSRVVMLTVFPFDLPREDAPTVTQ